MTPSSIKARTASCSVEETLRRPCRLAIPKSTFLGLKGILTSCLLVLLALGFATEAAPQQRLRPRMRSEPSLTLPASTPEAEGMDSLRLAQGIDLLIANREQYRVHSVMVVRNGHVVLDARFYPFATDELHDLASVTKSVLSTLVGIAIDKGFIPSVDAHMLDFFPGRVIANLDDRKRGITIKHLLTMRSGLHCDPGGFEQTLTDMTNSPDWVQFALDLPMDEEPGRTDVYCSPCVHLLSAILQQATDMSALEFAKRHLFAPLGATNVLWPADPQGVTRGWGDLALEPQDIAKLGALFLNGGTLFGRRVVSPAWIDAATTVPEGYEYPGWPEGEGRGYLWWLAPEGYGAAGRGEQNVLVYPDEELVIGLTGGGGTGNYEHYEPIKRQFLDDVLAAVVSHDALPANPQGVAELAGRLAEAAAAYGQPQDVPPLPPLAAAISGRTILLLPNANSLDALRFDFPGGDEAMAYVTLPELAGGPTMTLPLGLDDVYRRGTGRFGFPAYSKGRWEAGNRLVVMVDEVGLIVLWRIELTFSGTSVTGTMTCVAGGLASGMFTGTVQ